MVKIFFILGAINAFVAVALGAFGAHGLEGKLTARMLENWKTGVTYQMFHALGLIGIAFLADKLPHSSLVSMSGWFMFVGILIFSGSLYVLSTTGITKLGMITPIGGLAFLISWVIAIVAVMKGF
jgi:uncharacterized membrane protein YgdD (TMEM256/DUF423 family)